MLNKVSHIIFSFLLLITTMGLTVHGHYCRDKLISVRVFSEPKPCCDMPNCCHNESMLIQIEDDFSVSSFNVDFEQLAVVLPGISELLMSDLDEINYTEKFIPAPLKKPPKTILSSIQFFLL